MCLSAPAALIDSRIAWEELDALTVKATFTAEHCTVTATLCFAEDGRLLDFVSDDRHYIEAKTRPGSCGGPRRSRRTACSAITA